jgi:hypothetical protein
VQRTQENGKSPTSDNCFLIADLSIGLFDGYCGFYKERSLLEPSWATVAKNSKKFQLETLQRFRDEFDLAVRKIDDRVVLHKGG